MAAQSERELKFVADRKAFSAALTLPLLGKTADGHAWTSVKSVYFDSDDRALRASGWSLRVRKTQGRTILGLKTAARPERGFFDRDEREAESPSPEPDLDLFDPETAHALKRLLRGKKLGPRFGSDIRRSARTIAFNGATIEVALDSGFLFAGDRRVRIYEIEIELKSGELAALFEFGLALNDALPLKLGVESKAERAARLSADEPPEPAHAVSPALDPDAPTEAAFGALVQTCLGQFLGNFPALERGDSVEAVHQMRVAIRRLRSVSSLFLRRPHSPELDALRDDARPIGKALGEARDWDVLIRTIRAGPLPHFPKAPGFALLLEAAEAKATAAHAAVLQLARDRSTLRFVLSLELFVARRGWRQGAAEEDMAWASAPIADFASRNLDRLHHKALKRGKGFETLPPEERHALRIALKHLRYATEFFAGLFPHEQAAERYAEKTVILQDLLGDANDAAVAARLIAALDHGRDAEFAYAAGAAAGWCVHGGGEEQALREAWRSLHKTKPFWGSHSEAEKPA